MGGSRIASVGDEIVVSVKKARPLVLNSDVNSSPSNGLLSPSQLTSSSLGLSLILAIDCFLAGIAKLKKGDVARALVVRVCTETPRISNSSINISATKKSGDWMDRTVNLTIMQ